MSPDTTSLARAARNSCVRAEVRIARYTPAMSDHLPPRPPAGGTRPTTAASSATCARATAGSQDGQRGMCFVRQRSRRRDGADDLRPVERVRARSDREEAAQPLPSGHERAVVRHRRLQPRVQVLPELGHLEVARDGPARRRGARPRRSRARPQRRARRSSRSRTTIRRSSPSTRWTSPTRATRAASTPSPSPPATSTPSRAATFYAKIDAANVDLKAFTDEFYRRRPRRAPRAGQGHAALPRPRDQGVDRDHDAAHPGAQRLRRGARRARRVFVAGDLGLDVPLHFSAFHPDYKMSDLAADAARDAAPRAPDRARRGPALRLHRQRPRSRGRHDALPGVRRAGDRARLVRDPVDEPPRRRVRRVRHARSRAGSATRSARSGGDACASRSPELLRDELGRGARCDR